MSQVQPRLANHDRCPPPPPHDPNGKPPITPPRPTPHLPSYSIAYVVFEKDAPCGDYPPDEVTTFYDINIQYDYENVPVVWSTGIVDDVCNFRAHIVDPSSTNGVVNITWSTTAQDPPAHMIAASQATKALSGRVPLSARVEQ